MAKCLLLHGWLVLLKTSACCGLPIFLKVKPPTGEPGARNWPARFGGRGDPNRRPYPYQSDLRENALLSDAILPAYRSSNGSRTSNSLPIKRFHHQFLESTPLGLRHLLRERNFSSGGVCGAIAPGRATGGSQDREGSGAL